ncbi:MAG TPA: YtxH domain-containing protein [Bacteroidia bacterium]|jgi:gas vesicle protein|nr:YtxH domain-containing protein [Bacteroidia bacterium]
MKNTGNIIGALLLGAAVGATLGILFAPDKGSETRKKISDGAKDFTDDIKKKVKDATDKFKQEANGASEYAEEKIGEYKNKAKNKGDQFSTGTY